ncbi:uncharacterized protein LOC111345312 [Stylophora pistillata]|uniref:Death domain-containing protein n=1 Tax=Stylophora pistillata TaxID=50429 RepID=A0A2B4RCP2_STYPI|nr:uncharacterized protein LOC111345312 [Stylophora pistillata]PFX14022.1 hypothetical protein AWC38_SpisGene21856 [Stylophora pistillata]
MEGNRQGQTMEESTFSTAENTVPSTGFVPSNSSCPLSYPREADYLHSPVVEFSTSSYPADLQLTSGVNVPPQLPMDRRRDIQRVGESTDYNMTASFNGPGIPFVLDNSTASASFWPNSNFSSFSRVDDWSLSPRMSFVPRSHFRVSNLTSGVNLPPQLPINYSSHTKSAVNNITTSTVFSPCVPRSQDTPSTSLVSSSCLANLSFDYSQSSCMDVFTRDNLSGTHLTSNVNLPPQLTLDNTRRSHAVGEFAFNSRATIFNPSVPRSQDISNLPTCFVSSSSPASFSRIVSHSQSPAMDVLTRPDFRGLPLPPGMTVQPQLPMNYRRASQTVGESTVNTSTSLVRPSNTPAVPAGPLSRARSLAQSMNLTCLGSAAYLSENQACYSNNPLPRPSPASAVQIDSSSVSMASGKRKGRESPGCSNQGHKRPKVTSMDMTVKQGTPTNEELEKLGNEIGEHWKKLGRRLGVKEPKLQDIKQRNEQLCERGYCMLMDWKQEKGSAATYQTLNAALQHEFVQRKDLAEQICYNHGTMLESELPKVPVDVHGHAMEVDKIVKFLTNDSTKDVEGVLVSGIPGIGKSTVSIQAGHILKDDFGRIVKFCSLRDLHPTKNGRDTKDDEGESVLREILNKCQPGHQAPHENPRYVLLNWCRGLEQDLVLVLDNAEDAMEDSFQNWFIQLLNDMRTYSKAKIKFIITSRSTDIKSTRGPDLDVEKVPIEPLSEEDSIKVLKVVGRLQVDFDVSAEKLRRVAELCGHIPLALRLASALLSSDSEYSIDELIVDLGKDPTRTLECEAMMEIAFEKLSERLQHSLIRLSVFGQSFEKTAAKALLGDSCAEHLTQLKKRCFILKDGDRYFLHLLIRGYARTIGEKKFRRILKRGRQAFNEHFLALILRNTKMYMRKDQCKASFHLFNEERLNYESLLRNVITEKIRNCDRLRDVVSDCRNVALYVEYCIPVKFYEEFLNGLLRYVQKQNETVHEVEILCLLYHEGRKQGCVEKHAKSMDRASTLFQENQAAFKKSVPSEVSYLNHYGRYLSQDCEQIDKAQDRFKKALSMCESYEKETTEWLPDKATILGEMGHGAKLQGRKEEARKCYLQALQFRQAHFGNHILTAFAHKNLADYYLKYEDLPSAEENYMKAIDIMKRLNKAEHKEAIPVYKNMGICFEKSEMFHKSRKTYEKGSEVADNTIEGNHKWKVWIKTYLALLLHSKYPDDITEAVRIAKDVLQMGQDLGMKNWPRKEELEKMSQTH